MCNRHFLLAVAAYAASMFRKKKKRYLQYSGCSKPDYIYMFFVFFKESHLSDGVHGCVTPTASNHCINYN